MGKDFWANLVLCFVLAVLLIFAVTHIGSALTPKGLLVNEPQPSAEAAPLLKDIEIAQYSINRNKDKKVAADFYIRNNSDQDVKNIHVFCEFFDENSVYLDREEWILSQTFPSGEEHKSASVLERFVNMKGISDCRIVDLQLAKDPGFKLNRSTGGHGEAESHDTGHDEPLSGGH